MFPTVHAAPPITTQRPTFSTMSGAWAMARATFVSGPRVTRVRPGLDRVASIRAGTAWPCAAGVRGAA